MHSDLFIIKDFHRSFHHLLEKDETPVYNYEFKFDGEINTTKNILFATRPTLRKSLKGEYYNAMLVLVFVYLYEYRFFTNSSRINNLNFEYINRTLRYVRKKLQTNLEHV